MQPRKDSSTKRVNYDNTRVDKFEKDEDKDKFYKDSRNKRKAPNDVKWYMRNPELLKSAGSLPFASVTGKKINVWNDSYAYIPGVMSLNWAPAFGSTSDVDSDVPIPLNQAFKSMYSYLVHANSRNYTYEYQDLAMLVLAGSQVYAALANAIRAYGVAKTYSEVNTYLPKGLLEAMGFDPDDVRKNLSHMWFDINQLIAQTNQIWIPNVLPLLERWFFLNSNVYIDANDIKGQCYVFNQAEYYMYDATATSNGGGLVPVLLNDARFNPTCNKKYSWDSWREVIQTLIDALINDEDRGVIFGDILKAYGPSNIFGLQPISADYVIEPVYNIEILTQIENFTCGPVTRGLVQSIKGLIPLYDSRNPAESWQVSELSPTFPVINFHQKEQPTPEQIAVATRCMTVGSIKTTAAYGFNTSTNKVVTNVTIVRPKTCGTEIGTFVAMLSGSTWTTLPIRTNNFSLSTINWAKLCAFDWHPFLYDIVLPGQSEMEGCDVNFAAGDYSNYLISSHLELEPIHDACVFSLLGMPHSLQYSGSKGYNNT